MTFINLDGALCVDRWDIFDRTDDYAHRAARTICADCPVVIACQMHARNVINDNGTSAVYGIQGTWGGQLFGRPGRNRPQVRTSPNPPVRVAS